MDLMSLVTDNVSELLAKIINFTRLRRRVLQENLRCLGDRTFIPRDLPTLEFAATLHEAVMEHEQSGRLVFRDSANVRFGEAGAMRIRPVVDGRAAGLLQTDLDAYIELQVDRLLENLLNEDVAEELLRQSHSRPVAAKARPRSPVDQTTEIADA